MVYLDSKNMYFRSLEDCGYGDIDIDESEVIVTQEQSVYNAYKSKGYDVKIISLMVGLPVGLGIYEVFSYFFDGDVRSDFDMLAAIFNGVLLESRMCFCLKIERSFCWFRVRSDGSPIKMGSMVFGDEPSAYTVGRFFKRLRYEIAMSGCRVARYYSDDSFKGYLIPCTGIDQLFNGVSIRDAWFLMSKSLSTGGSVDASSLVAVMDNIVVSDDTMRLSSLLQKDFSICTSPSVGERGSQFGIILDCEGVVGQHGVLSDGCRELGGLIWCKNDNILVSVDMFSCDLALFEDTLIRLVQNFRLYSSTRQIKVLTFGASDQKMFTATVESHCSIRTKKMINSLFSFRDCKKHIDSHVSIENGRNTLANIARSLNVAVLTPRHSAVNDARTLLNVLAMILYRTGDFIA